MSFHSYPFFDDGNLAAKWNNPFGRLPPDSLSPPLLAAPLDFTVKRSR